MAFPWPWRFVFRTARRAAVPDGALPGETPEQMLAAAAGLMRRLRLHAAMDDARFSVRFEQPLLRLAVHLRALPSASLGAFVAPAELFRSSLETAYFSFQAADGRIFTGGEGVERRHALEWRWRYVCFLAGMFHPLGAASAPFVPAIVGPGNLAMLEEGDEELVRTLCRIVAGECAAGNMVQQVVAGCRERLRAREGDRPLQAAVAAAEVHPTRREAETLSTTAPVESAPVAREPASAEGARPARFADYVPQEVRAAIGSAMQVERLGMVVKAWRDRGADCTVMRRIEHGAAIELAFLARQMPNVPAWVDAMAGEGLVYAPPATPGLRIQKVRMAEGCAPVPALVLSNLACRRLGL